jgi:hypothetical protein
MNLRLATASIVVLTALGGVFLEPSARAEEPAPAKITDWMVITPGDPAPPPVAAFNGSTLRLRWIVREAGAGTFRVVADSFQLLTATLAPIEANIELGAKLKTEAGRPVELTQDVKLPESDKPLRLLIKLWIERNGQRRALTTQVIHGWPRDLLAPVAGTSIKIAGFDPLPDWVGLLKDAEAKVDSVALPKDTSWEGTLIAQWPKDRPVPTSDALGEGQRLLALTAPSDPAMPPSSENAGFIEDERIVLTIPHKAVQHFANDPEIQLRIVRFLSAKPKPQSTTAPNPPP